MRRIFRSIVLTIILVLSILFLTGCDGGLDVTGIAFEWINAPPNATSQIYITNVKSGEDIKQTLNNTLDNIPKEITKLPLENVNITIALTKNPDSYIMNMLSNSTGEFSGGKIVAPTKFQIRVKATKEGYQDVYKDITHDTIGHVIVILLVKNKN